MRSLTRSIAARVVALTLVAGGLTAVTASVAAAQEAPPPVTQSVCSDPNCGPNPNSTKNDPYVAILPEYDCDEVGTVTHTVKFGVPAQPANKAFSFNVNGVDLGTLASGQSATHAFAFPAGTQKAVFDIVIRYASGPKSGQVFKEYSEGVECPCPTTPTQPPTTPPPATTVPPPPTTPPPSVPTPLPDVALDVTTVCEAGVAYFDIAWNIEGLPPQVDGVGWFVAIYFSSTKEIFVTSSTGSFQAPWLGDGTYEWQAVLAYDDAYGDPVSAPGGGQGVLNSGSGQLDNPCTPGATVPPPPSAPPTTVAGTLPETGASTDLTALGGLAALLAGLGLLLLGRRRPASGNA